MKRASVGCLLFASFILVGCGDPSKEDVCGDCRDANVKAACETGYDQCAGVEGCAVGDYAEVFADSGVCPPLD